MEAPQEVVAEQVGKVVEQVLDLVLPPEHLRLVRHL